MCMSVRKTVASHLKKGNYYISQDGAVVLVLDTEHSKAGKHGHAKMRIESVGLFEKKRRSEMFTADAMIDIPEIEKRNGQLTNINDDVITIMDTESFETLDCAWPMDDEDAMNKLHALNTSTNLGDTQVEYWVVMNQKIVRRILLEK